MADSFTREQIEEVIEDLRDAADSAYWQSSGPDPYCNGEQSGLLKAAERLEELLKSEQPET
jgi:hypothetical protein